MLILSIKLFTFYPNSSFPILYSTSLHFWIVYFIYMPLTFYVTEEVSSTERTLLYWVLRLKKKNRSFYVGFVSRRTTVEENSYYFQEENGKS